MSGDGLTAAALNELVFLSDPQWSADGSRAFCVRTRIVLPDEGHPAYRAQVCEATVDAGEGLRVLAEGPDGSEAPRPSPDGATLAFLSKREGDDVAQAYLLDLARGGEARRATRLKSGVRDLVWSPDGAALLVLGSDAERPAEGDDVVARTVDRLHAKKDGLPWPGIREAAPAALWWVPAEGAEPRRLATLPDGIDEIAPSPDGRTVWLLGARDRDEADAWRTTLWRQGLGPGGTPDGEPEAVSRGLLMASGLAVSQDGATLAWLAPGRQDAPSSVLALWTLDARGGEPGRVTGDLAAGPSAGGDARHGRFPNRPVHAGAGWIVNANREGASAPTHVSAAGEVQGLLEGRRVTTAFAHATGRTLAIVETPARPGELHLIGEDGRERPLTDENGAFVRRYALADGGPERCAPNAAGGVPWWRMDPVRPREDGAIVIQVHGGPRTNVGYGFSFEFQLLAARGYAVVSLNPRGSSSYGDAYGAAVVGAYGGVDADDVLSVVDDAVRTHATPNPPVHLTGGSYGGYTTNLLVTRTDRFRSAVTQRSICNWLSFYGTSDIGYRFAEHETGGTPWADAEHLWHQSPLAHAPRVRTPILILHADADHRCPVEQAEQWFVALKRIGEAETRLVRFADEGHELSRSGRPDRRIRRLDEIVGWFEAHP